MEIHTEFAQSLAFFKQHCESLPFFLVERLDFLSDFAILATNPLTFAGFCAKAPHFPEILKGIPKSFLCFLYISLVKRLFPDTKLSPERFSATFALELRSSTLKRWKSQAFELNFAAKTLSFAEKRLPLDFFAVRWIGNYRESAKTLLSLDSFKESGRNLVIGSDSKEKLRDFFENLREILNNVDYFPLFLGDFPENVPKALKHCKSGMISGRLSPLRHENSVSSMNFEKTYRKSEQISGKLLRNYGQNSQSLLNREDLLEKACEVRLFEENVEISVKNEEISVREGKNAEIFEEIKENRAESLEKSVKLAEFPDNFADSAVFEAFPSVFQENLRDLSLSKLLNLSDFVEIEGISQSFSRFVLYKSSRNRNFFKLIAEIPCDLDELFATLRERFREIHENLLETCGILNKIGETTEILRETHKKPGFSLYFPRELVYMRSFFQSNRDFSLILEKSVDFKGLEPAFFARKVRGHVENSVFFLRFVKENVTELVVLQEIDHKFPRFSKENERFSLQRLRNYYKIPDFLVKKAQGLVSVREVLQDLKRKSSNSSKKSRFPNENLEEIDRDNRFLNNSPQNARYHSYDANLPSVRQETAVSRENPEAIAGLLQKIRSKAHFSVEFLRNIRSFQPKAPDFPAQRLTISEDGLYILRKDWKKSATGQGLVFLNREVLKAQKNMLTYLIKRLGSNILQGKPINSIAFPIELYDPMTELQKFARDLSFFPEFLENAAKETEAEEIMKWVVAAEIASLHMNVTQKKPFASGKGETFFALLNGNPLYFEQLSTEPSISAFLLKGKGYDFHGFFDIDANLHANSCVCRNKGRFSFNFAETLEKFTSFHPFVVISGTAFGQRSFNYEGKQLIINEKRRLVAEILFNPDKKSLFQGLFAKNKALRSADSFAGAVFCVDSATLDKLLADPLGSAAINRANLKEIAKIEGVWHEFLQINGKTYWEMGKEPLPFELVEESQGKLPSDSHFREDVALWKGGEQKAQVEMEAFAVEERRNEELRRKTRKKNKNSSKK